MSEQNVAHTPTPWRVGQGGRIEGTQGDFSQGDFSFIPLASPWQEEAWDGHPQAVANAALIVRAVNSHDELVALLKRCERILNRHYIEIGGDGNDLLDELNAFLTALSRARGEGE